MLLDDLQQHMRTHGAQLGAARAKLAVSWTAIVAEMLSASKTGEIDGKELTRLSIQHNNAIDALNEATDELVNDWKGLWDWLRNELDNLARD